MKTFLYTILIYRGLTLMINYNEIKATKELQQGMTLTTIFIIYISKKY